MKQKDWTPRFLRIKRIRHAVVIPLAAMFLLTVAAVNILVYLNNQSMVRTVLSELRQNMQELVANELNARLDKAVLLNEVNAGALRAGFLDMSSRESRERYFSSLLSRFDGAAMTYIGFPDGSFYGSRRNLQEAVENVVNNSETGGNSEYYSINEDGDSLALVQVVESFDPRTRPWYKTAVGRGRISFGTIYSHFVAKEPTLTASLPLYEGDNLMAVLGVDYLMTWLGETLQKLPVGPNGQVFITDGSGRIVATTSGESIFHLVDGKSQNILAISSSSALTRGVGELVASGMKSGEIRRKIDGHPYLIGFDVFVREDLSWILSTAIREDDFLGAFNQASRRALIGVSLISLFFLLFAFRAGRQISQPILALNEGMRLLQEGKFETVPYTGHLLEIQELTNGFNEMGLSISGQVDELENEVLRRTAELEEKNNQLFRMARMDELMQIPNRRQFDEFFGLAHALTTRNGHPIGIMMLDIDFFKSYNDTYGHVAGDDCLKQIGTLLSGIVKRKGDLVARFGGEEFVVVMQETSEEGFREMAERIRTSVGELGIPHEKSITGAVTISIGAVYGPIGEKLDREAVIRLADEALYDSKNSGRNKVSYRLLPSLPGEGVKNVWTHADENSTGGYP